MDFDTTGLCVRGRQKDSWPGFFVGRSPCPSSVDVIPFIFDVTQFGLSDSFDT